MVEEKSEKKERTPSFVVELRLDITPKQAQVLSARMEAGRQVYNACLGELLQRRQRLIASDLYQQARLLPQSKKGECNKAFAEADKAVGFSEAGIHAYAKQFQHCWIGDHLDMLTMQKLATRAFIAVKEYHFKKRGRPRFKSEGQIDSLEGKKNSSGIRWKDYKVEWLGLTLTPIIDVDDEYIIHGLQHRVKFVRIVRRKVAGRQLFYVQLVCEGYPYPNPENELGKGEVGLDIGPSTIAIVGENEALLLQFCSELESQAKAIRRLQRKIDRQRRASNPNNYHHNGTIKKGKKTWKKSNRQKRTEAQLAELHRKQAAYRESLHGQLINHIFSMGNVIHLEKLSYRAFQKLFGKSVGMRAPGKFVEILKRKAASAGVSVHEFPTFTTKLSQTCHHCGTVVRKPLSQRWHECECGIVAQRDLYSAFLAMHIDIENHRLNADRAQAAWSGVDMRLRAALREASQLASGTALPSSFGLNRRKASRLSRREGTAPSSSDGGMTA